VICLPFDLLPGWLFTISSTRVHPDLQEKIHQYRQKCYRALWEAFVRGDLFSEEESTVPSPRAKTVTSSGIEAIDTLTEQINTLSAIVAFLQEHRRALREEARQVVSIVEAGQQELLHRADQLSAQLSSVSALLEQLVGRHAETEAHLARIDVRTQRLTPAHARAVQGLVERIVRESERRNKPGSALIHAQVYGRLKTHFRAGKFDEIPDERYPEVEAFLRELLRKVIGGEEPRQGNLFEMAIGVARIEQAMGEMGQTSFHAFLKHALDREANVQIGLAKDRCKREKADLRSTPLSKIGRSRRPEAAIEHIRRAIGTIIDYNRACSDPNGFWYRNSSLIRE
jgi:hypothetical protein